MKAIQVHQYGTPEVLRYETLPDPQPGRGQVMIRVESAAVNYSDVMRRSNTPYPFPTPLPFIPGSEVAGTIAALGEEVSGLAEGMAVFALVGHDGSTGYAQYAIANAQQVIPIPPGLAMDQACGLVVAGLTAQLILGEVARLQPGERILIQGASGGVGGYAVQLARLMGAGQIIGATSSPTKGEAARALGADAVVDYTQPGWAERVRDLTSGQGVHIVLEMNGGKVFAEALDTLAPFGRAVVYGMASREPLHFDQATIMKFFYNPSLNQSIHVFNLGLWFGLNPAAAINAMQALIGYAASGQIKIPVNHVLPLSRAADAHRMLEERRTTGKIVLKPWDDA